MNETGLPYGRQWLDEEDVSAVREVLLSDFLTTGPAVDRFEAALMGATGAGHAVAVSSGTAALHAMYFAAGIGPGDEIVTTPLTFAATANAALYLGASVRFSDVLPDTGNIDPSLVQSRMGERTRAIVAVDFAGHPADYAELSQVASHRGLLVLADAAHSLGAEYHGRRVGTLADASALSFHPVKPITTAEGGAVVTSDADLAMKARLFRTHGVERTEALAEENGGWFYQQTRLGFNYRLTDVQAALGASQLKRLDAFIGRHREIAARYLTTMSDVDELEMPGMREDVRPGWHLFVVRVRDASRRRAFYDKLRQLKLAVQVHYIPVYLHPYYRDLGYRPGLCPVAEDYYARAVSLPIYPRLTDAEVDSVIDRVLRASRDVL